MTGGPHLSTYVEGGEGALTQGRLHVGIVTPPSGQTGLSPGLC
jgi:hypothetical protein